MRKVCLICVSLFTLLVSCSVKEKDSPEHVAKEFLTAMQQEDYDKAKELCDEKTAQLMDMLKGIVSETKKDKQEKKEAKLIQIIKSEIDQEANKAKVFYTEGDEGKEQSIDLKKIEGKWKVAMDKENGKEQNGMPHSHDHDHLHDHDHSNCEGIKVPTE